MVVSDGEELSVHKDMGLVTEVFRSETIGQMEGDLA